MTTWLLPSKSGQIYQTASGTIYTGTLGVPVAFEDADATGALANGWTTSNTSLNVPDYKLSALGVLTSGTVKYFPGTLVAESVPNTTLNDTSGGAGTTLTQIGFMTIPGGAMGIRSRLRVKYDIAGTGANAKTIVVRAGAASGTFATATSFGGQTGLSTQLEIPGQPIIWNNGSLSSQFASGANVQTEYTSTAAIAYTSLSIDTSLDWNIYIGVQFGLLNGGDTMTLRQMFAQILN